MHFKFIAHDSDTLKDGSFIIELKALLAYLPDFDKRIHDDTIRRKR